MEADKVRVVGERVGLPFQSPCQDVAKGAWPQL